MLHPGTIARIEPPLYTAPPETRADTDLVRAMLDTHNHARRSLGASPLQWDPALANNAALYASEMARSGSFQHDLQEGARVRQGENLWRGTRGAFSYAEMSGSWIEEKRLFKNGLFPNGSRTGKWSDVGHYTQIIWLSTTRIGCAIASNPRDDFLVCRYSPAGNIYARDPLKG